MLADLLRACQDFREAGDLDAWEWAYGEICYLLGIQGEDEIEALCRGLEDPGFIDLLVVD